MGSTKRQHLISEITEAINNLERGLDGYTDDELELVSARLVDLRIEIFEGQHGGKHPADCYNDLTAPVKMERGAW